MGTTVSVKAVTGVSESEFAQIMDLINQSFAAIEQRFSRFRPDSELSRLNAARSAPFPASAELFAITERALQLASETNGAFDPTILNSLLAEGYTQDFEKLGKGQIKSSAAAPRADHNLAVLDRDNCTITLPAELALDLGGIVKGYAVDQAVKICAQYFQHFLVNAGGDTFLRGYNLHGQPWRVGVEHPSQPGELLTTLTVTDQAVATSGSYKRRWQTEQGESHHIIDPATGHASTSELASVTVLAKSVEEADSLATAIFVLGAKKGLALAKQKKAECLLATKDLQLFGTPGIEKYVV